MPDRLKFRGGRAVAVAIIANLCGAPAQARESTAADVIRRCQAWLARIGPHGHITDRIYRSADRVLAAGTPLLTVKYPAGTRTLMIYPDRKYRAYCED